MLMKKEISKPLVIVLCIIIIFSVAFIVRQIRKDRQDESHCDL